METSIKPIQKIIVRMPNWIGDLVMATAALKDLRKAFPEAKITAMVKSSLKDLLDHNPYLDEILSFTASKAFFLPKKMHKDLALKIREGAYDVGILFTNSLSSSWFFFVGGVKRRIGYRNQFRNLLLTDAIEKPNEKMHHVDLYKLLLTSLSIPVSRSLPHLFLTQEEIDHMRDVLTSFGVEKGKKIVAINPGAAYGSAKCWPEERFKELAHVLSFEDIFIVFIGDVKTDKIVKNICQGLPSNVINLSLRTNLRELLALLKIANLLITNDSGPMHMALSVNTPIIALFGSTDSSLTGPYQSPAIILDKKAPCSPCFKRTCPIDFKCMKEISVKEVLEKARGYV